MRTVIETPAFSRRADRLLTPAERGALIAYLASNPMAGEEIIGTGGVRKLRYAVGGKGKSGGVRVITFFSGEDGPIFAVFIYGKHEQATMTPVQTRTVAAFAAGIKAEVRKARRPT